MNLQWQLYSKDLDQCRGLYLRLFKPFANAPVYVGTATMRGIGTRFEDHRRGFEQGLGTYFRPALANGLTGVGSHAAFIQAWGALSTSRSLVGKGEAIFVPSKKRSIDPEVLAEGMEYFTSHCLTLVVTFPDGVAATTNIVKLAESRLQCDLEDYYLGLRGTHVSFKIPGTRSTLLGKREFGRIDVATIPLTHSFGTKVFARSADLFRAFEDKNLLRPD